MTALVDCDRTVFFNFVEKKIEERENATPPQGEVDHAAPPNRGGEKKNSPTPRRGRQHHLRGDWKSSTAQRRPSSTSQQKGGTQLGQMGGEERQHYAKEKNNATPPKWTKQYHPTEDGKSGPTQRERRTAAAHRPRRRKPSSTTQLKRGIKQLHPTGGRGRQYHQKEKNKKSNTAKWRETKQRDLTDERRESTTIQRRDRKAAPPNGEGKATPPKEEANQAAPQKMRKSSSNQRTRWNAPLCHFFMSVIFFTERGPGRFARLSIFFLKNLWIF